MCYCSPRRNLSWNISFWFADICLADMTDDDDISMAIKECFCCQFPDIRNICLNPSLHLWLIANIFDPKVALWPGVFTLMNISKTTGKQISAQLHSLSVSTTFTVFWKIFFRGSENLWISGFQCKVCESLFMFVFSDAKKRKWPKFPASPLMRNQQWGTW
jgi:hypothetical protein